MIKTIIFDVGGVLVNNIKPHFEHAFKEQIGLVPRFLNEPDKLTDDLHKGKMSLREFLRKQLRKEKVKLKKADFEELLGMYQRLYHSRILYDHDVIELSRELKNDYKIVIISDTIKEHSKAWIKKMAHFDYIFTSHDMKMKKTEVKAFRHVLKKIKMKPEECVFIDANQKNLDVASKIGMKSILYVGYDALRKDLLLHGV